jgi:hypothetical protein
MKQRIGIRIVATAMMTAALTMGGAGLACAQDHPESSWRQKADRATHALNMLEAQGFTRFSDFQPKGTDFTARVRKHGQTVQVTINPDTNQILTDGSTSA